MVLLGGTIAGRVPRDMLDPRSPFSAPLLAFLSHRPPPSSSTTWLPTYTPTPAETFATVSTFLPSSAPATPVETFTTVFKRVSLFTLEELATLADTLPADLHSSVRQLLRHRLTSPASVLSAAEEDAPAAGEDAPAAEEVTTAVTSPCRGAQP